MRHALVPCTGTHTIWSHFPPGPASTVRRSPAGEDSHLQPLPDASTAISTRLTARVFLLTPLAEPAFAAPRNTCPRAVGLAMFVSPGRTTSAVAAAPLLAIDTS